MPVSDPPAEHRFPRTRGSSRVLRWLAGVALCIALVAVAGRMMAAMDSRQVSGRKVSPKTGKWLREWSDRAMNTEAMVQALESEGYRHRPAWCGTGDYCDWTLPERAYSAAWDELESGLRDLGVSSFPGTSFAPRMRHSAGTFDAVGGKEVSCSVAPGTHFSPERIEVISTPQNTAAAAMYSTSSRRFPVTNTSSSVFTIRRHKA